MNKNEVRPCSGIMGIIEKEQKSNKEFAGFDVNEIAEHMGISADSARTRANRLTVAGKLKRTPWLKKATNTRINLYSLPDKEVE